MSNKNKVIKTKRNNVRFCLLVISLENYSFINNDYYYFDNHH